MYMLKIICLFILFVITGCGKPLTPYDFNDAIMLKKSLMHRELGILAQKTMDEIAVRRLLLHSKTINPSEFEKQKKEIQEHQQTEIKKIQNDFSEYKNNNQKRR